jgi:polysaccharide deacetylase 2 family uncharacterized protein YibQ
VRGLSTAFWSIVLLGSSLSIGAGFVGGRSIVDAGALKPVSLDTNLPAPIRQHFLTRALIGPHSLDAALGVDPYGDPDLGVVTQPAPRTSFDAQDQRAKIAVIVVDAGRAGPGLKPFLGSGLPLTYAIAPSDDDAIEIVQGIVGDGREVLVDDSPAAKPAAVAKLIAAGALGVMGSLDGDRAAALMRAVGHNAIVVDAVLGEDDEVAAVGRRTAHRTFTRDVIADARDDSAYVDFMFRDALGIAQRRGVAIVAVHARSESLNALMRFADQAERDGADLVALSDLGG